MRVRDGHRAGQRIHGETEGPAGPGGRLADPFRDRSEGAGTGQDTRRGRGDQRGQLVTAASDTSWVGKQVQKSGQTDCVYQRSRRGSPDQLFQRGGHEERCRSRH